MKAEMRDYRIGHKIAVYDITEGCGYYASKWGVTDFYPKCEKNLRWLVEQKEDFMTEWCDCKKEIVSAKFSRVDGAFHISVSTGMDDLWESTDLIADALSEVAPSREDLLENDEFIDLVRDMAQDCSIDDNCGASESLEPFPTYEQVVKVADNLEEMATKRVHEMYEALKEIVRECVQIVSVWAENECEDEQTNRVQTSWDAIAELMDDEIREQVHAELAPCTEEEFFARYCELHEQKYGEEFVVN